MGSRYADGAKQGARVLGVAMLFALPFLGSPAPASAEVPHSAIVVERDPEVRDCPDETALRSSIVERLGRDPFAVPSLDGWLVDVWFLRPDEHRRSARVLLYDAQRNVVGTRFLDSAAPDCGELADTVVLTLAMVLEAQLEAAETAAPEPAIEAETPAAEETASDRSPPDAPEPREARASPFVAVSGALALGFVPRPALLAGLEAGVRVGTHAVISAEGRVTSPASASNASGEARVFLGGGALFACYRAGKLGACATCTVAATVAQGTGGLATERSRGLAIYPGIAGTFEHPLGASLALVVRVELEVAARRVELEVVGDPLWRSPPVVGALGIGLAYGKRMR
ncbi:MAG: hypothetical protein U0230_25480 [Polyangiales bacterium]